MRRSRFFLAGLVAILALMAFPPTVARTTAHAAAADCTAGEVCVWPSANYGGPVTIVADEACHNASVGSVLNGDPDTMQELRVYAQPNCSGAATVVKPNEHAPTVSGQSYVNWHAAGAAP
jgi:hypothetical protein